MFLAFAGAFGTQAVSLYSRLLFWVLLMVAGSLCASFILIFTSQRPQLGENKIMLWAVPTVLVTIPMAVFAWGLSRVLFGFGAASNFPFFLWVSLVISGSMTALMLQLNMPGLATHGPQTGAPMGSVRFMGRLPQELKGAAIYAVKSEDHYLTVYSSNGSALILSRLSDAISELDGIEGAQVHRSWWVARDAIAEVLQTRNRTMLKLKNDVVAPVSRPNVKELRDSGWI
ncbi:MAG: LytTR family transcriptional regulator [Alphaproteobacteria bacterium]|nr:LytTR family transcriptional regulator [Alphaproteobacteria bacterium]